MVAKRESVNKTRLIDPLVYHSQTRSVEKRFALFDGAVVFVNAGKRHAVLAQQGSICGGTGICALQAGEVGAER